MFFFLAIVIGILVIAFVGFAIFVLSTEERQYQTNDKVFFQEPADEYHILVAYTSRSKNTEVAAKYIAEREEARLLYIEAEDYKIGFKGWLSANIDARKKQADIVFDPVDFSKVDTLYIGSPIWWYSPSPPTWEFIRSNDLQGVKVILFNTFNSKFDQEYIDEFADLVKTKGGVFAGHLAVNRGRMGNQIGNQELNEILLKKLAELKGTMQPAEDN